MTSKRKLPPRGPKRAKAVWRRTWHKRRPTPRAAGAPPPKKPRPAAARGAILPRVNFHAAFEADRQRFVTRGGANWLAAINVRWNLFNGFADKAHIAETGYSAAR